MKTITAKLGKMRKAVEWVVYPGTRENRVLIQCNKRICCFDPQTGEGTLSASHNYPGFHTLMMPGCEKITVPEDVRKAAVEATPKSGDRIGPGVYVA